jgi:hydrogenase maturation protein HypF
MKHYSVKIQGLVQGVGFRPFIYRIATAAGIKGSVENRNDGVIVRLHCDAPALDRFINEVYQQLPLAASIENIDVSEISETPAYTDFSIVKSTSISDAITEVSPDICVCDDCLHDMERQENRLNYPFINCTNCGPRFTIIRDLPYDREKTSMQPFRMCPSCHSEYTNILDRRFHAQPVACNNCGPHYEMRLNGGRISDFDQILKQCSALLKNDGILAVKGLGGYFLACNALSEAACARLRSLKNRESKPFAVMFRNIESLREYCLCEDSEKEVLTSWRRPIVLLTQRKNMAASLNKGLNKLGCMLPYMPFHFILFQSMELPALVMTSGNISDEPIYIDDEIAFTKLSPLSDAILSYNRTIENRCDDSVLSVVNDKPRIIRRSRGYVPNPIRVNVNTEGILACGAELKNTFALGKDQQCILSQHIGDLKNLETYEFFVESIDRFSKLFRFKPAVIACDQHPDYSSSRYAAESGLPLIKVQHHHAHIVSVMAEHNVTEQIIGVSFDGTGLGDDQAIWGGEFFVCDNQTYQRVSHIRYKPMPGGDAAAMHPWRMAVSYLYSVFGAGFLNMNLPMLKSVNPNSINLLVQAIDKNFNVPMTSSAGRLFDAVAAICGICTTHAYEAEGPMLLEAMADKYCKLNYPYEIKEAEISFDPLIEALTIDVITQQPMPYISARFHNTIADAILHQCLQISANTGIHTVALSGGVFMNNYLLAKTENLLKTNNFKVITNFKVPVNDGGLSLGQLVSAAYRRV